MRSYITECRGFQSFAFNNGSETTFDNRMSTGPVYNYEVKRPQCHLLRHTKTPCWTIATTYSLFK